MLLLCGSAGCQKDENAPNENPAGPTAALPAKETRVQPFQPMFRQSYMVTDKGWYFLNRELEFDDRGTYKILEKGLYYLDTTTGKELPLCNKPECRHDGNQFCTATNARYRYTSSCLYNERIYLTAVEETDTQFLFKLLYATLDGSELNEVVTFYTAEKTDAGMGGGSYLRDLFIHRDTVFLTIKITSANFGGDFYGTAVYNMNTKELHYLDEEPVSRDNFKVENFRGRGNTIFYCRWEKRNYVLYRYDITNGNLTTCELLTGFNGNYDLVDENTVIYVRPLKSRITYYDCITGENEFKDSIVYEDLQIRDKDNPISSSDNLVPVKIEDIEGDEEHVLATYLTPWYIYSIITDGTYFYFYGNFSHDVYDAEKKQVIDEGRKEGFRIYNKEFQLVAETDILPALEQIREQEEQRENKEFQVFCQRAGNTCIGDDFYLPVWVGPIGEMPELWIYKLKCSDLLAGTPSLTKVYILTAEDLQKPFIND